MIQDRRSHESEEAGRAGDQGVCERLTLGPEAELEYGETGA